MAKPSDEESAMSGKSAEPDIEAELLRIVCALAVELHPKMRLRKEVSLDSDLDRDLGFDSLGRAELILRLDRAFKVRLPDQVLGEADTPRDLLAAVRRAGPQEPEPAAGDRLTVLPRVEEPVEAQTFIEVIGYHIDSHFDRPHLCILEPGGRHALMTFGALHQAALQVGGGLLARGLQPGDRVAIMLPTGPDFFKAFFGILYAGCIPVPIYPPFRRAQVEDHLRRQAGILNNAGAKVLIVSRDMRPIGTLLYGMVATLAHIDTVSGMADRGAAMKQPLAATADTIALIQYTSGSTGDPKGVVLTHANLLANIRAMGQVLEATSEDVFVSWLPLYHDMGLIGAWLGSLYFGARAVIMSPLSFLADPGRWLRAISRYRGTLSVAPNFAFELCCKSIRDSDLAGCSLTSLRAVLNGAEPVSARTISRFTDRFAPYGFRPEMMGPVYGLAECSVGLAFPPLGRFPIVDRIDRLALSRDGEALPAAAEDETALTFVACGQPLPGHEVRVVDDFGHELPERREGRLQFRGPSTTQGYFQNEEKTKALFSGDWLESGDLAYLAAGDIFITSRVKDIIIKAGHNIYPQEVEEWIGGLDGVRKGCVAAIASKDLETGTEKMVLVVETRVEDSSDLQVLKADISTACLDVLGLPPDVVILVPPRTIPKTSSGKIRRAAVKQLYEADLLEQPARSLRMQLLRLQLSAAKALMRRFLRQAGSLAYAAYWWAVLCAVAIITWSLVIVLPSKAMRYSSIHHLARLFLRLTGTAVVTSGLERLQLRNAVVVANHSSYLDGLVMVAVSQSPLTFIAKAELAGQTIAGPFLRRLGALFAHRGEAVGGVEDTHQQQQAVRAGETIMSFPEGTLTRMPGLLEFHLGPFAVAAKESLPVLPVTIRGTRFILRGGQWFPQQGRITVTVDEQITPEAGDFDAARKVRDKTRAVILQRCGEPDLSQERVVVGSVGRG